MPSPCFFISAQEAPISRTDFQQADPCIDNAVLRVLLYPVDAALVLVGRDAARGQPRSRCFTIVSMKLAAMGSAVGNDDAVLTGDKPSDQVAIAVAADAGDVNVYGVHVIPLKL